MNFAITNAHFSPEQIRRIDPRFYPYMDDWYVEEIYKDRLVRIPSTWDSQIFIYNYYEVNDKPGEVENEKELSLACGWRGMSDGMFDREVLINLRIDGRDVLNTKSTRVKAEIIKTGGAQMRAYFNHKLVTDFMRKILWFQVEDGYQTVPDMQIYL